MKKLKFKSSLTYTPLKSGKEKNTGKSKTVPNQSMTIQEIVAKYRNGIKFPDLERQAINVNADDDDDIDYSRINDLDLVEQEELHLSTKQKIDIVDKALEESQKAKAAAAKKEQFENAVKEGVKKAKAAENAKSGDSDK